MKHQFEESLSMEGWMTIGVILIALYVMVREIKPPDVTMLICAGVLVVFGAMSKEQFLEGFSSDIVMTIAMLCVIVRTLEINGILAIVTKHILPKRKNGAFTNLSLLFPVSALSAFLNNTAIVLFMTPAVRKWALKKHLSPSKYLIPLSYASIVGGLCTIIGTSTNVIVDSLIRKENPEGALSFFELGFVGVPCVGAVLLFLVLLGQRMLPHRVDVTTAAAEETKEFTGEFLVDKSSLLANKLIKEVAGKYFPNEMLVEIERFGKIIDSPGPYDVILPNDRLVFAGDIHQIAELHTIRGLKSAADPHFELDETSSHFSEVVIALTSSLVGRSLRDVDFRKRYGASVLAIYREGIRVPGKVREVIMNAGDTLVLLSSEPWPGDRYQRDFYYLRYSEKLTIFNLWRSLWILSVLIGMVFFAFMGAPLVNCTVAASLLFLLSRCISLREAQRGIIWNVLLLIASSFAVANAVESTGVASYLAKILLKVVGKDPYLLIGAILLVGCLFTEMLSNNAAALMIFPVALEAAHLGGYSSPEALKAIGITVAIGASCGFALPNGYQTHMIVYGPGGYKFRDFLLLGIITDLIVLGVATFLIPSLWPLM